MITIHEWKTMSGMDRTTWLHENCQVNGFGGHRKPLFGVGVNDAEYCQQPIIHGGRAMCPAYVAWSGMIKRCYSEKYHVKWPTYSGVKVCDEWHSFSNFMAWWMSHQVDGWHLDKDILSYSREYSPETSLFVPDWLNIFTIDSGASRGEHPIGVNFDMRSGKFRSTCRNPMTKKQEHLGLFETPEAAHAAWLNRKLELALELKPKMDEIDPRIYPRVVEIINNAK